MNIESPMSKNATLTFGTTTFNEEGTEATVQYSSSEVPGVEETITVKKVEKEWLVDMAAGMPAE